MTPRGGWRGRALEVAAAAVLLVLSGCGDDSSPEAVPSSSMSHETSATPSGSSTDYPCLTDAGVEEPSGMKHDAKAYVGLTLKEAKQRASDEGLETRLAGRDGTCFAMTMDYRSDRVNFYVEDDVVVVATMG